MVDKHHEDKGMGSFLAEYIDDESGSTLMNIFLLLIFGSFYASNFYIIKQMNRMLDFVRSQDEEYLISQSILTVNNNSEANRDAMDMTNSEFNVKKGLGDGSRKSSS